MTNQTDPSSIQLCSVSETLSNRKATHPKDVLHIRPLLGSPVRRSRAAITLRVEQTQVVTETVGSHIGIA